MTKKTYPRIGERGRLKAAPMCCICGAVATHWVTVQVSYMRGDDEVKETCDAHRTAEPRVLLGIDPAPKLCTCLNGGPDSCEVHAS